MTTQEKELIDLIERMDFEVGHDGNVNFDSHTLAKAIIAKYPQILAEKVWEGFNPDEGPRPYMPKHLHQKNIQVFIREVK